MENQKIWIEVKRPKGKCQICGMPKSDRRVSIPVNNFRGDDDVFFVHWQCIKDKEKSEIYKELNNGTR